jgi:uncharacterized protein (DUF488 family)
VDGKAAAVKTIWTIGHSTRPLADFLDLLAENDIQTLVDVRTFPGSRKHPHFKKENLEQSLPAAGVEYVHIAELGGRRKPREDSPNAAWRHPAFRAYADYMETPPFREGVKRLEEIAGRTRTCIMCSEAVWWRCHRSLVADCLKSRSWDVRHIVGRGAVKEHPYTQPARIVDGLLTYRMPLESLFGEG